MTTEVTFYGQNYETDEWYDIDYDSEDAGQGVGY